LEEENKVIIEDYKYATDNLINNANNNDILIKQLRNEYTKLEIK